MQGVTHGRPCATYGSPLDTSWKVPVHIGVKHPFSPWPGLWLPPSHSRLNDPPPFWGGVGHQRPVGTVGVGAETGSSSNFPAFLSFSVLTLPYKGTSVKPSVYDGYNELKGRPCCSTNWSLLSATQCLICDGMYSTDVEGMGTQQML